MSFDQFGLSEPILRAVAAEQYTTATPIQAQAIPHVVAGRDLLGCAQTGTGKTAAFALPILHRLTAAGNPARGAGRHIRALIIAPTRELAAQIGDSFRAYGRFTALRHTVVFGGVSQGAQVKALRHGVDVLIATPGRLMDLMNQGYIDLARVECFVLDEADRMLDMGFLPDIKRIVVKLPTERQTVFFSATMPPEIESLANNILRDPERIRIAPTRENSEHIEQSVCFVPQKQKTALLVELIKTRAIERAIVFTRTKHGADRVAKQLHRSGISAEAMHGNKSQNARQRILTAFKSNRPPVLVATDVASRGIDVTGVSHVFNFDLPREAETYVHRIGRTGRAGAGGCAVSFCDGAERGLLRAIERLVRKPLAVEQVGQLTALPAAENETQPHEQRSHRPVGGSNGKPNRFRRFGKPNGESRGAQSNNAQDNSAQRSGGQGSVAQGSGGQRSGGQRRFKKRRRPVVSTSL